MKRRGIRRMRRRELILLASLALTVLALGWVVARDLRQSAADARELDERLSRGLDLIGELQFSSQEVRRILLYALHTTDANLQLAYAEQSRAADARVHRLLDENSVVTSTAETRDHLEVLERVWREYLVVRDEVIGLILESSLPEAVTLDETQGTSSFNHVRQAIAGLKASFESEAAVQVQDAGSRADRATVRLTLLVTIALIAAAVGISLVNRWAALEDLLRIEAHKGSILQAVPDPIVSTDGDGRIIELNEAAERTFGVGRSRALGQRLEEVILPPHARGVLAPMLGGVHTPRSVWPRVETVGRRHDGTEFPIELAAVSHTAGGELTCTVHISDTTVRRQTEEQLRRAKEAAEGADRAKSDFLTTMSHELRTPLSAVIGIADLLQTAGLTAPQRDLIRMLRSSATALHGLVSDILDYSRIEAGLMNLIPVRFSIQACIEDALDPVTESAARKGLDLGYLIDDRVPPTVVADESHVRQVLLNLLSNAVKFTAEGEIAVYVSAAPAGEGVLAMSVRVRDSGTGIPEHLYDRLFQRFSQIPQPGAATRGGAGLGLAISERLSRLLGGSLSVESSPGRGSTFTFVFMARVSAVRSPDDLSLRSLEGTRVLALLGPGIVGDQVRAMLARWGVDAWVVSREADWCLASGEAAFDAVLVDADALDRRPELSVAWNRSASCGRHPVVRIGRLRPSAVGPADLPGQTIAKPVRAEALYDALRLATRRAARPRPVDLRPAAPRIDSSSLAILLVEDNDANRRVTQLMLAELGLYVDEAQDGYEAVARAQARHYDVILMDVQMPGLDGLQAARRIRAEQHGKPPVIIALTANVVEGDEARCREAGMDAYLPKPVRLDTLAAVLAPFVPPQS